MESTLLLEMRSIDHTLMWIQSQNLADIGAIQILLFNQGSYCF